MNRWTFAPVLVLSSTWLNASAAARADAAAPATSASQVDVSALITKLGDPDPTVRGEASLRLSSLGATARPALAEALHAGAPEVRMQAGAVPLKVSWAEPTAPDPGER